MRISISFKPLMRKTILALWLLLSMTTAYSQKLTVTGSVSDTSNKKQLANASILLLKRQDSVLVTFGRANAQGQFSLQANPGRYWMMVTSPGFVDYGDSIDLRDKPVDIGNVYLTAKSKLLQEIIIRKTIPAIRMKGDTVVYKADSFRVAPGATVEDLLKKLPGITVDKNGNITAQGERVRKILVDGEEFFSDDPTIATKNLQSAMVDELEIFDKKSDQAEFTGIDDGQRTKTINLKIKEDKKNGYFGKIEAGSDFDKYWSNNAMLNYFKGKKKFAGYGIMASDGRTGLNWNEMMNYGGMGGNMETEMNDDGGMMISIESGDEDFDWGGRYNGEGLPRSWSAGMHYSNKWDKDKQSINGNYRYRKVNNDATTEQRSQNILPDTSFFQNERSRVSTSKMSHSVDGTYNVKLDSTSSIKVFVGGTYGEGSNFMDLATEALTPTGDTVNKGTRRVNSTNENQGFNSTLTYRKKFKKPGNTFSFTFRQNYRNTESDGFLRANNTFFDSKGQIVRNDIIDQEKLTKSQTQSYSGRASYTQPLNKKSFLEFNYSLSNAMNYQLRQTLEETVPGSGKYDQVVDLLSNEFDFTSWVNQAGVNYRISKTKKYNFTVGGSASYTSFTQKDLKRDSVIKYNFVNFFPQANLNLTMKKNTNLYVNYRGATQQPTINMLQPVVDNSDPLNVSIGNPELDLAVNHNLYLWLNRYDMLNETGFFMNYSFSLTQNAFSSRTFTDSIGRRVYQTVNVNGVFNNRLYFDYNFKLKKPKNVQLSMGPEINFGRNVNIVNNQENKILNGSAGINFRISHSKEKVYELSISANPSYNFSNSSINTSINTNYWLQNYNFSYTFHLGKKWDLGGEVNANFRQQTEAFNTNTNAILWNSWLDRKFTKNNNLKLRLYAFDILDQNIGFQRTINSNYINERTFNTFNRYLMLSVIWNFSKNGKPMEW